MHLSSGRKTSESSKVAETGKSIATTTGQGAAGAAKLSTEQRGKITTVIRQPKVKPAHLDVPISVGSRVPSSVHYHPLPVEVVTIYPEWRGYDYILVGDQIVIIDPRSHEIVAIIEASPCIGRGPGSAPRPIDSRSNFIG